MLLIDISRVAFTSKFRTGIDLIDEQHQVLFDLINRIDDLLLAEVASTVAVARTIEDLVNYALYHFATEERLIARRTDHARLDAHVLEHNEFRGKVADHWEAVKGKGRGTDVLELQAFLKHWIIHHVLHNDIPLFREMTLTLSSDRPRAGIAVT